MYYNLCVMFFRKEKKRESTCAKAFSIVEVLLASFVMAIGLGAVLQLFGSSLNTSIDNRDAIIASGLAQEGVELVYNIRDNNYANGSQAFPTSGAQFPGFSSRDFCRLGYNERAFILSGGTRNCFRSSNSPQTRFSLPKLGGFYAFSSGNTKFARVIAVDLDSATTPKWATVTSIVWWGGSMTKPTGVFPDDVSAHVNLTSCTFANHCVFSRVTLTDWK